MKNELNFTKPSVESLPPASAGTRATWHDTEQPGLILRVTDTGAKSYYAYARVKGGNPERVRIGDADKFTPTQARAKAKEIVFKLTNGESFAGANKVLKAEATLNDMLTEYFARAPMKPRSLAEYKALQTRYISEGLGKFKLSKVTPAALARLHSDITMGRVKGFKGGPTTANRMLSMVKAAFNWAANAGMLSGTNPASRIQKNRETSRERYVEPHELAKFFAALSAAPDLARAFFMLAVLTGARRSNVCAMRWVDVDIDAGLWTVSGEQTKNGDTLKLPLVPEAIEVLKERLKATGGGVYVLPGTGKLKHYREPKRAWATIKKRAGMPDLNIHDLRRTLGSWLVRTGASTAINMKALGHKSMQAAAVYQRIADTDPVREAVGRATSALLAGGGMKQTAEVVKAGKAA
ncbi:MAG: site-specific integrase [Rhodoferax sp.]|jgi:integrase|nr:site-specific integrase [Rhodoferax sp.]